ncbi:MAG TPA: hypothetical protein HPP87_05505 [Planctomycetes bacterium]|nr:hypothetical protein [Planctomycetota bacterium]
MKNIKKTALLIVMVCIAAAGIANAATTINSNITVNTTWSKSGNPYHLVGDIYVKNGATLTIEAGVIVASFVADDGSLAVCRDSDIRVMGTQQEPVIMTSANDVATWAGSVCVPSDWDPTDPCETRDITAITTLGDPKTGFWRPVCQEWGSLAIMGKGYLSGSHYGGVPQYWDEDSTAPPGPVRNTKCPGDNRKSMEGLHPLAGNEGDILYGGTDDDDDSGEIHYLSLRYGGRDTDPRKELNGISLGALGRETDIDHIDIMNNIDDGIEIWGGTCELSYVNIWNIGDDSFDVDEGWRGCVDTGMIVQGYCHTNPKKQGGGIGDNCLETDGAEDCDAQPVTTAMVSNFTIIGQPQKGDGGTAWRDNARVQYDNCIWMDVGDDLVLFDNADTDGARGYDGTAGPGTKGSQFRDNDPGDSTLNWVDHWTTSYNIWKTLDGTTGYPYTEPSSGTYYPDADPNNCGIDFAGLYEAYVCTDPCGMLCQITNSIFYNVADYTEYDQLDSDGANFSGNVKEPASMPIQNLVRGPVVAVVTQEPKVLNMEPVDFVNPLPIEGVTAGAFNSCNWLSGWTAADAFGKVDTSMNMSSADLDCDGNTNMEDLADMAGQWLQ